jgi:cytochrome P450
VYAFTIVNITRTVTRDTEWHGVPLRENDVVLLGLTPANRRMFGGAGCPVDIDLTRAENPHLAFGLRNHRCIGMHLARRELEITVLEWHNRFPDYELAEGPTSYFGGGVFVFSELLRSPPPCLSAVSYFYVSAVAMSLELFMRLFMHGKDRNSARRSPKMS